jgi:hypothetical protein
MTWVSDFLRREPEDTFFGPVRPADGTGPGPAAAPESAYLSLHLESLRVSAVRRRAQTFYGAVTSTCTMASRRGGTAELVAVSTPESLRGADAAHLDRVITGTVLLAGPVPYRGGGVAAEVGLFTVPAAYLSGPYLDLLGTIANMASAFLSTAAGPASSALMAPVRQGLDLLLGATAGAQLEVGLAHTWLKPVAGHYAVVRAAAPEGGYRIGPESRLVNPDGSDVRAPYLLLRLAAERERPNWAEIPDVRAAYEAIADAARAGDLPGAHDALAAFRRVAVFSPDLLAADGSRLYDKVAEEVKLAFPETGTSGAAQPRGLPALNRIRLYGDSPAT